METEETKGTENASSEKGPAPSCCEPDDFSKISECCQGPTESDSGCSSMMSECMKGCRYFPLIPVILGTGLLLLSYFLDPRVTRVLWMILSSLIILLGMFGSVMMSKMSKK
jgi:hypothetical protein